MRGCISQVLQNGSGFDAGADWNFDFAQEELGDDDEREARQLGALCVCCAAHYVTCYVALHGGIRIIYWASGAAGIMYNTY